MGIIKAFKLGFDYLKYDEDGNVQDTQRAVNDPLSSKALLKFEIAFF